MKKFLSLVLALVMTMSLVTISAGATDFTDDESITYQEAIDVISAIGVVTGYSDGSFKPTQPLTRGAAAKIITNLILGPSTASTLVCTTAPFPDVPANHTFAAAITYCAQNKIISGYGNGNFVPDGTLTGFAFLKMLLGALGYDGAIEGFTGANWTINVAKLADGIGLTDKVAEGFSGSSAVDRQTACLFAFNTIKSDLVEYDNRITANVGGVDVAIGGNNSAKSVQWQTQATRSNNITRDNIVQFGERYFSRLVRNNSTYNWDDTYVEAMKDNMGRPATKWTFRGESIGTYADTPALTFNGSKTITDIYNELKMADSGDGYLYINGVPFNGTANDEIAKKGAGWVDMKRSNDKKLSKYSKDYNPDYKVAEGGKADDEVIGDGTLVEVFHNDRTNEVVIAAMSVYGGKIATVKGESAKKGAYVTVDAGTKPPMSFYEKDAGNNEFVTTGFSSDDVVAFTYSDKDTEIVSMYKMESVEGNLTKYTSGKNLTLGETVYKYAKEINFGDGMPDGQKNFSNGSGYIVYLDANGYALWVEEAEFSPDAYALVRKITVERKNGTVIDETGTAVDTGKWDGDRARLLFADGTTKTVDLSGGYSTYLDNDNGDIKTAFTPDHVVRYRKLDNGAYKLTAGETANNGRDTIKSTSDTSFKIKDRVVTGLEKTVEFDSKTIFVINENGDYNIYTGIRNAPNVSGGNAYVYVDRNDLAKVVFVTDGTVVNSSKSVTFIAGASASKYVGETDGDGYYTYNAVVKGEIKEIMVAEKSAQKDTLDGKANILIPGEDDKGGMNMLLNQTSYDDELLVFGAYVDGDGNVAEQLSAEGLRRVSSNEIRIGTWNGKNNNGTGKVYTIADGTKVFYVDDGGDIEQIEASEIASDPKVDVFYTLDDGEINNLFIVESNER